MGVEISGNASISNRVVITIDEYGAALSRAPIDMKEGNDEKEVFERKKAEGKRYVSFLVIQKAGGEIEYRRAYFTTMEEAEKGETDADQ